MLYDVCSAIKLVSGTAVTLLPCFTDRTKIFENWHSCKFSITGSTHFLVDANEHTSMKLEEGMLLNFLNTSTLAVMAAVHPDIAFSTKQVYQLNSQKPTS